MTVVWALSWLGLSAALVALTAVLVRLPGCRRSAAARHVAWLLALFLCAGLLAWPLAPAAATAPAFRVTPAADTAQAARSFPLVVLPAPVTAVSWWVGWIWVVGAASGLAAVAHDVRRVVRMKRRTVPLSLEELVRLGSGMAAWASRRAPRIAWCDAVESPAVLGFFGPVIALPRSQVLSLSDEQARLVVLHELAHVRRGDDWWALAGRIAVALTWVNPAVHWIRRELSLSREMACDQWVVRQTAAPVAYAKCLTDIAGLQTRVRRLRLAAGVIGRPGSLRRRVVGVLALDRRPLARAVAIVAWVAPVAVCVAAVGLLHLPPMFMVANPPDATVQTLFGPGPARAAVASVGRPDTRPEGERPLTGTRRVLSRRRPSGVPAAQAVPAANDGHARTAPTAPDTAAAQSAAVETPPLAASPLPGAGAPGVTAAAAVTDTISWQDGPARWWSWPAAIGESAGGAAATGGRATASFFTRLGSRVPQLLTR
jgi:beta-lactamase regulating signal transducer with metallopeptidase domain